MVEEEEVVEAVEAAKTTLSLANLINPAQHLITREKEEAREVVEEVAKEALIEVADNTVVEELLEGEEEAMTAKNKSVPKISLICSLEEMQNKMQPQRNREMQMILWISSLVAVKMMHLLWKTMLS